ncbi:MAG: tRNA (adenosine(37)-N6)-threonylcarbamoyltransferase complex dimerization subunit type 1 TsaB [Gemmatimonadota bacterium]
MSAGESKGTREDLLLAFDASWGVASVAVGFGDTVLASRLLTARGEHARRLVPAIDEVLAEAGVNRSGIGGIVVGRGPGSFTGVRVAAATARALAVGLQVPLWTHSSLAAGAASKRTELPADPEVGGTGDFPGLPEEAGEWPRFVLLDARGRRIYAGCYRILDDAVETLVRPHATTVDELVLQQLPQRVLFCGDGAMNHAGFLEDRGHIFLPPPVGFPTAEGLLRWHRRQRDEPPLEPGSSWEPEYLRGTWSRPADVRSHVPQG